MAAFPPSKTITFVAAAAVIFGIATVVAGSRVLLGSDPGYTVFMPLLLFNTAMGFAYIVVGILAWRRSRLAARGAGLIALLNLGVLGSILVLYASDGPIAINSLQAMTFRTTAWVVLFFVIVRTSPPTGSGGGDAV